MRYRAAATLLIGLVALAAAIAAIVATTNTAQAGPRRRGSARSSATQPVPALCAVAGEIGRLTVTRTDAFPQNRFTFSFPARATVRLPDPARAVAHVVCALRLVPPTSVLHCPADLGIDYQLDFVRARGGPVKPVRADATGCELIAGAGVGKESRFASGAFWKMLGRAIGLARPTDATFRGSRGQP